MNSQNIPTTWLNWSTTGKHGGAKKKNAIRRSIVSGHVRGYFSDIPLDPTLSSSDSMYPSFDHLVDPTNHQEAVVECRLINDMKSHLSEDEFWKVVEHLFVVGTEKGKIKAPFGKRLPRKWSPKKHYSKINGSTLKP